MARVFISHSSRDNEPAARIKAWLAEQGFETPFLDYDKHAGIPPGADWEKTLYREIERSEAIVIIQTPNWLDSKWCFAEFTQARALGKSIFPIIETPTGDTLISPDIQAVATKNIVRFDFVDFFSPTIVRSLHENYCPPRPVHAARPISNPRPPTSRSPGAPPTIGHGKPNTTQTTQISLESTAVLGLALPSVAWLPANTAGLQTRHLGALASQGLSTVLDVEVSSWPGRASTHRT